MPPPSDPHRTTKLLSAILGLALLGLGSMVALTEHGKAMAALKARSKELAARRDAHLLILADRDSVAARDSWVLARQPVLNDVATASGTLLDFVKKAAVEAGVDLENTRLLEPGSGPAGPEIGIELKASAPFEKAIRFLHALQAPEHFNSASRLSLKSDAEPPNVVLELRLVRHYAQGTSAP